MFGQEHVAQRAKDMHEDQCRQRNVEQTPDVADLRGRRCSSQAILPSVGQRHGLGHENDSLAAIHVGMQPLDQRRIDRLIRLPADQEIGPGAAGGIVQLNKKLSVPSGGITVVPPRRSPSNLPAVSK